MRAFKSGSRSGTSSGLLVSAVTPVQPRGPEEDGSTVFFLNQLRFSQDETGNRCPAPAIPARSGSRNRACAVIGLNHAGSDGTDAIACRIEDVLAAMGIRFA